MPNKYYMDGNGVKYPLSEAPYDYGITVYKSDCKKAVTGDPNQCLIAKGIKRDRSVEAAYIGSGKDAYVIFKASKTRKAYALHFTINAQAARVRDFFDTHKGVTTQDLKLSAPTPGRTLAYRRKLNKTRAAAIKAGTHKVKPRGPSKTRVMRLGVHHRPRASVEHNAVSVPLREAA